MLGEAAPVVIRETPVSAPSFSPTTNLTANFRERVKEVRALLVREGLGASPESSSISLLFGYEGLQNEETLTSVVLCCANAGRPDVAATLVNYLSELELGKASHALRDARHDEVLERVLPMLNKSQFLSFLHACMRSAHDDLFDTVKPFLRSDMITPTLLAAAAFNKASRFGRYYVENTDVLQALREIQSPNIARQVASLWAQAIEAKRVPRPDLGRAAKHWRQKFPELGAAMLAVEMESSLPPAAPGKRVRI